MAQHIRFSDDDGNHPSTSAEDTTNSTPKGIIKVISKAVNPSKRMKRKPATRSVAYQIRSLQRYLRNKQSLLPPGVLKQKQSELEQLQRLQAERKRRVKQTKYESRYKQVKFFETRKLQRILEKITKNGDRPEDADAKLKAQRDLRYIRSFPSDQKYIALFPSGGHSEESKVKLEEMRAVIEAKIKGIGKSEKGKSEEEERSNAQADDFFLSTD